MIRIIDHEGNGYGAQAEITRKKGVNGEKSLTGVIYTNDEVLNGADRGWKIEFENERYAFIFALPKDTGNQIELEFDAVHEFFYDMSKNSQNDLLSDGSHTFKAYLDFIFKGTGYNYRLDVDVQAFEKQNFGQKNRLDLFYDVIDTAGVEFSVNGSVVRIIERVGNDLSTIVKKGFNLNELRLEKNIGNFVTYQKGFGAWNDDEDHSKGRLEVEYLSPLAEIYGKLDADPVVDERYTVKSNLENRLKSNVEGSYQISVQIDMEDLTRAGYEYKQPHEGDSIMAINEDLGFQRKVRIVSYETDFDVEGNILDHRITCNSVGMVEESILSSNSIKNSIKELQTDLELTRKQVIEFNVSADGKSTNYYGSIEPSPDEYKLGIGDTWFDSSGEDTIVKVWNGVEWRKSGADVDAIRREIESAQQEIAEVKQTADDAVGQIDTAVANAGFTSLDETISSVQTISNQAQINAGTAIDNALEAMQQASQAVDNTGSLNVRVDEVEDTLSIKADKQMVDDLTGVVDLQALDIKANADGLKLKANQDTVDLIDGRVNSLGTEVGIVAGQISNKVWKTDIESAVDGIEIGGRNLLLNTAMNNSDNWTTSNANSINYNEGIEFISNGTYVFLNQSFTLKKGVPYVLSGYFTATNKSLISWFGGTHRGNILPQGNYDKHYFIYKYTPNEDLLFRLNVYDSGAGKEVSRIEKLKLEKGTIATDWTPAPEDTDAKFDYIETEWTQTFERFDQTVSDIDGRVTAQTQEIDRITRTIQDVTEDVEGNTTKINQTVSTVDKHTQTIANIETDLDGKVETSEYNTLVSTVDSTIRRIGDAEGNITQVEESIEGVQTIVAGKADKKVVEDLEGEMIEITAAHSTAISQTQKSISQVVTRVDDIDGEIVETQTRIDLIDENINLRLVKKDEIITQINLSEENILLQANKIQALGDVVVDGKLTITDEFIAPNAQIDGAKIADATIGSAKIASLDASKITTGVLDGIILRGVTGEFAGSITAERGYIGSWNIRGGALSAQNANGTYSMFKSNGSMLSAQVPRDDENTEGATLQIFTTGEIRTNKNKMMRISMYQDELNFYANDQSLRGSITGGYNSLDIRTSGVAIYLRSGTIIDGYLRPNGDADSRFRIGDTTNRWYRLYANQSTYVSSDARYKDNIREIPQELLEEFTKLEPKTYEMDGKTHFGYIAQDVERVLYKYALQEVGFEKAREYMEQFDMLIKDESYMGLVYAELAVLKDYEQQLQIKELENRIEELENAS